MYLDDYAVQLFFDELALLDYVYVVDGQLRAWFINGESQFVALSTPDPHQGA
jgi:hypothetical protein